MVTVVAVPWVWRSVLALSSSVLASRDDTARADLDMHTTCTSSPMVSHCTPLRYSSNVFPHPGGAHRWTNPLPAKTTLTQFKLTQANVCFAVSLINVCFAVSLIIVCLAVSLIIGLSWRNCLALLHDVDYFPVIMSL